MKNILLSALFLFLVLTGEAQQAFWLDVQPGKLSMPGDGMDYTTLVIAARNADGEVITSVNGKVKVRVSSGFVDDTVAAMQDGVAMVRFTSPMFGTPVKSSQRMVYFMFKLMEKFIARSSGSPDMATNQKLATDVAMETIKEGFNPIALIPAREGDNNVYIVCELNGVKGKAKIEINKESDSPNGNIIPGVYYGRDITGQSEWVLDISGGGQGYFGEATGSEQNANTILFTNETFTEFNDAMGKMAGMTGFMKAYLGPPESETKYLENFNIREQGMPSAYMPMPKNGVFVYVPPILFEYAGRRAKGGSGGNGDKEDDVKFEKTGIVFSQKEVVGDGRSRTKAVFHYEDENGHPVSGKSFSWEFPKSLKIISSQTVTDASGNAVAELEVPVIKAGAEKRGENTGALIDNYDLFQVKANYTSAKGKAESTLAYLTVFKTLEQDVYILKAGMEPFPYKVLLPQLEYYNLESSVYAMLPESYMTIANKKTPLNDAMVFVASRNFDKANFLKLYEAYFKKDRQLMISLLENENGGYSAITDAGGNFKLIVRDTEGKKRLYSGGYDRKAGIEPLEAKLADLTGRRKGALTEALSLLAGGDAAVVNSQNAGESGVETTLKAMDFKATILTKLLEMERDLCSGQHQDAIYIEEKLHIIGMIMTNIKGSSRYISDCANIFGEQAYEAIKFLIFFAAEKYNFNEKVFKKLSNTEKAKQLKDAGIDLTSYLDNSLMGQSEETAKRSIAMKFLLNIVTQIKQLPGDEYYKLLGHAANYALTETQKEMLDAIVDAVVKYSPTRGIIGDLIVKKYYAGQTKEVLRLLNQDPVKVHAVYEQLQPALRDRSTEIRQQYSTVAAWRLNLDDFKAYTDLFADLVAKGAVVIVDAYTQNYAAIEKHLEYIDKAKNVLNAAYHAASLGNEFISLRNLWSESDAALIYANRCIEQGSMSPVTENRRFSVPLFPSAMAAGSSDLSLLKGVPVISAYQLSLKNGRLPVAALNHLYSGYRDVISWFSTHEADFIWLSVESPDLALNLFNAEDDYNEQLQALAVLSMGIVSTPGDDILTARWKEVSGKMEKTSSDILKVSGLAADEIKGMEVNPGVNIPEKHTDVVSEPFMENTKMRYLIIAVATLVIAAVIVFFMRKRRKRINVISTSEPDHSNAQKLQFGGAPQTPVQPETSGSKFCTKCGSTIKPGAKFCGKCGAKV